MTYIETPSTTETNIPSEEIINKAGDVVIDDMYITKADTNINIKNFSPGFTIFEDMFSNFLTGELTIVDAGELVKKLTFNGSEFLTVSFRTPQTNISIKKTFSIYTLKNRFFSGTNREETYILGFTSIENIKNNVTQISKKFTGKTDVLAKKIFDTYLKIPRFVDGKTTKGETPFIIGDAPHKTSVTFLSPYWSPVRILNWIASRSIGKEYKAPNTLFFETNKRFYFTSIENLIMEQLTNRIVLGVYVYSPTAKISFDTSKINFTLADIANQYTLVQNISPFKYFDIIQGQDTGYFTNTIYTHDILLKEAREFVYNHGAEYDKYYFMEDYKPSKNSITKSKSKNTRPFSIFTPASERNVVQYKTKQYKIFDELVDPEYQTWVSQRSSLMMQLSNLKLHITVAGKSDLEVGRLIYFAYPQAHSGDDKEFKIDNKMSGMYMITAIKHNVSHTGYDCVLEITKDSFFEGI